ncbi:zinc finger, CCHC-type containing protein [Tanacetum coccineum]
MVVVMKHMDSNFAKLDKFEGVDFRRWQKKMHLLLSSMNVMYVLTTLIPEDGENATIEQIRRRNKMLNLPKNYEIPWRPNIWLRMHQDSDKPKGNNVAGPLVVNMVEHYNSIRYNDNKGKRKHQGTKANPNKKSKVNCWKCGKPRHLKKDCKGGKVGNKANGSSTNGLVNDTSDSLKGQNMFNKCLQVYYVTYVFEDYFVQDDDVSWWVNSGTTVHVFKDRCWFKTYESLNDRFIFHMGNKSSLVHRRGCVDLRFSFENIISVFDVLHALNIRKNLVSSTFMSTSKLNDSILWHARLGNKKYFVTFIDDASRAVFRLLDPKLKTLGERGIECIFVGYAKHSKAFSFYVIEPNESISINLIIELRDVIFDENRLSSVPRPSQRSLINGTKYIGGSAVLEEVTKEVVAQQPEPELEKAEGIRL